MYSTGGTWPQFNTRGKVWAKGPLHSHLRLVGDPSTYSDCDIVEVEVIEKNAIDIDIYCQTNLKPKS